MSIQLPREISTCNQYYNNDAVDAFNNTPYYISLDDFSTSNPESVVSYLNGKLSSALTMLVVRSCLRIILDTDIFVENCFQQPTLKELRLMVRYLDIILFSRHVLHNFLCSKIGDTTNNIDHLINFLSKEDGHGFSRIRRGFIDVSISRGGVQDGGMAEWALSKGRNSE